MATYAIGGGMAVVLHVGPLATDDVDIFIPLALKSGLINMALKWLIGKKWKVAGL